MKTYQNYLLFSTFSDISKAVNKYMKKNFLF